MGERSGRPEWPTWIAVGLCTGLWLLATWRWQDLGPFWAPCLALLAAFHSSLQHEALHGHPTRNALVNEAIVFPALGLIFPYRRFRATHLRHHDNTRLTDPYDDPESWYITAHDELRLPLVKAALLRFNGTLLGRLLIGPALAAYGFWRADWRAWRAGRRRILPAYALHVPAVGLVIGWSWGVCGIHPLAYAALVAYPAASLIMIRTYIEHRAAEAPDHRSAIVRPDPFFSLLFLNNNLHWLHHARPTLPWYELPRVYASERAAIEAASGGYVTSYGEVFRRFLLRRREPLAHPFRAE